mgnify:FL=1
MNAKEIANNAIAKAKADWVKSMTEDFYADEKKNPLNIGAIGVGNTIIVAYADSVDEPLIGVAKCNPTDSYDREVGIAIAYARAIGEDIPDYVLGTYEDEDDEPDWDDDDDWDEEDEDDDWDDEDEDEDDDWDDDDDWDEDEDELPKFGELGIGARFIDSDTLYIKVDKNKAYSYQSKKVLECNEDYPIDEVVAD